MNTTEKAATFDGKDKPSGALILSWALSAMLFFTMFFLTGDLTAAPSNSTAKSNIQFQFDEATGELTIHDGERALTVARKIAQKGKERPLRVWFKDPDMKVPLHGHDHRADMVEKNDKYYKPDRDDQIVQEESFDPEKKRLVNTYRWGKVIYQFEPQGEQLDLAITVHNTSEKSIWKMDLPLLYFALSRKSKPAEITEAYFGSPAQARKAVATFDPVVLPLLDKDRAIVACSPELEKPLTLRWIPPRWYKKYRKRIAHNDPNAEELAESHESALKARDVDIKSSRNVFWRLFLTIGGDKLLTHRRYTSRTIDPGESDTFRVSLRFGDADRPLKPATDIIEAFARENSYITNWEDRRPILRNFIGDKLPWHFPSGPEMRKPEEVEPSDDFREYVRDTADKVIKDAETIDAQGVIVWNVEGPNQKWLGYVGDPRMVEYTCPEMDAMADEFFAKIRDAGLRTGVTLRPRKIIVRELPSEWESFKEKHKTDTDWIYGARSPREEGGIVDNLSAKVQYAQDRWGCTLFYIDANYVTWEEPTEDEKSWWPKRDGKYVNYRTLMNAEQYRELKRRHPDCLFIPEHGGGLYYTATAPYGELRMNAGPTPPLIRATWPDAFKALSIEGRDVSTHYPRIVDIFANRNVALVNSGARNFSEIYRDAAVQAKLRDASTPPAIEDMSQPELLDTTRDAGVPRKSRYFAARHLLQETNEDDREDVVETLLEVEDSLITRMAILSIDGPGDAPLVKALGGKIWRDAMQNRKHGEKGFIMEAISRIGPEAIPLLVEMAGKTDRTQSFDRIYPELRFTAEALGTIGTPEAKRKLQKFLEEETDRDDPLGPYVRTLKRTIKRFDK